MSTDPRDVVVAFCEAWERRSAKDVLGFLADDVVYQNVPGPVMRGIEAASGFLSPILEKTTKIDFELLSIAVSARGDEVLTERMDRLHFSTGVVDIPIMGIFVVRDGKIVEWRDYADSASVGKGFVNAKVNLAKAD